MRTYTIQQIERRGGAAKGFWDQVRLIDFHASNDDEARTLAPKVEMPPCEVAIVVSDDNRLISVFLP